MVDEENESEPRQIEICPNGLAVYHMSEAKEKKTPVVANIWKLERETGKLILTAQEQDKELWNATHTKNIYRTCR